MAELLERIGARLGLDWVMRDVPEPDHVAPRFPPATQLARLRTELARGHVRGIVREIDALGPEYAAFTDLLRKFAARFDLEAMAAFLDQETS